MIHIVDYGLGNVQAFVNMYKKLGFETFLARNAGDLETAKKIILPGVGAFDCAMDLLTESGMREVLNNLVLTQGIPILGICVGMQILASSSEEGVGHGLAWIPGKVCGFAQNQLSSGLPMPHMGWNDVLSAERSPLFRGIEHDARFYFLHSYYFECLEDTHVSAITDYGVKFACAIQKDNVFGVQFHPEKSHHWGAALLKNFAEL